MRVRRLLGAPLVTASIAVAAAPALAQTPWSSDGGRVLFSSGVVERPVRLSAPLVHHDGRYIVVHLRENRVFVFEGSEAVWSAPAGTGTGFRLASDEHRWRFSTPRGLFHVRRMEEDPVWQAPDWYYVERKLPIPPEQDASRRMPGVMGSTALYLGDGIAIHGTNRPDLLLDPDPGRRRVSHGCIRLTDEAARELMTLVDVGTPVLIF